MTPRAPYKGIPPSQTNWPVTLPNLCAKQWALSLCIRNESKKRRSDILQALLRR